jgi:SAM-dependent methyltransferase
MLRFFVKDVPIGRLSGCDVGPEMVNLASSLNPWIAATKNDPLPPLDFPDNCFNLIYLYSVFSHLSEDAHEAWVAEFGRLVRPGGLLIATTWPREFIEWCEAARKGLPSPVHHPGGLRAFDDPERWLAVYDQGSFCYSATGAGANLTSDFYGESCIPLSFVERWWSKWFKIVDFIDDRQRFAQNVIVGQRHTRS